jgi:anthranilate/para-aminobenzoate synthase component I
MFMKAKRQHIRLNHPKKFDITAHEFSHKTGLCIFELDNTWRILSWWNQQDHRSSIPQEKNQQQNDEIAPFSGGWVGWMKYPLPKEDVFFWKTDGGICYHIPTQTYHIIGSSEFCREAQLGIMAHPKSSPYRQPVLIPPTIAEDQNRFCRQVEELRTAIRLGKVYQANLSRRSKRFVLQNPLSHYLYIHKHNQARFGCYMQFENKQVISNSPELFLRSFGTDQVLLHSQPIKGTAQQKKRQELWDDKKEKAELTMIVDLVRNDLGKIAKIGSVFTKSRALRRCGDLLHAEQSIYAQLDPEKNIIHAINSLFPAGSITGAPTISAMQYISELEEHPRNLYTGSVGFIANNNTCHFNVAIRTLFIENEKTHLHVGCGIVHDSQPQREWQESIAKGNALSKLLFT